MVAPTFFLLSLSKTTQKKKRLSLHITMVKKEEVDQDGNYSLPNSSTIILTDEMSSRFSLSAISGEGEKEYLGFTDWLDIQDYNPFSLDASSLPMKFTPLLQPSSPASTAPVSSEVLNAPPTPSVSVSSVVGNYGRPQHHDSEAALDEARTKETLKPKNKNQKKEKEARVAFMTKSEVDYLDDGYRWRKYGQKSVKNSTYPRCTALACRVKKRVERLSNDPSTIVTTYEGQHNHPTPLTPHGIVKILPESTPFPSTNWPAPFSLSQYLLHRQNQKRGGGMCNSTSSSVNIAAYPSPISPIPTMSGFARQQRQQFGPSLGSNLFTDHGLLQDVVPLQIRGELIKDEKK